jgi:hypothetical protein
MDGKPHYSAQFPHQVSTKNYLHWHVLQNFVSDSEFCFRACKPGPKAATLCQHIYDVMGCQWNMPGNYDAGFSECLADSGEVSSFRPRNKL